MRTTNQRKPLPDKARPVGLEPTTYGLEVRCSIQLSYRRVDARPAGGDAN